MSDPSGKTPATLNDGVLTCQCGSTEFRYDESHPSTRRLHANKDGVVAFISDFEWFDGDDDPGVVCARCEAEIQLPEEVTVDFI